MPPSAVEFVEKWMEFVKWLVVSKKGIDLGDSGLVQKELVEHYVRETGKVMSSSQASQVVKSLRSVGFAKSVIVDGKRIVVATPEGEKVFRDVAERKRKSWGV